MKKTIKNILFQLWLWLKPKQEAQNVFLIGHPRSGSSLLMHILTSNPQIIGFGEYLTQYNSEKDLLKAEFDIRRKTTSLTKKIKYVANQVNHHSVTPTAKMLVSSKAKIIFILRTPQETLSSMVLLSKKRNSSLTQNEIAEIYNQRLTNILDIANAVPATFWIATTYTRLIEKPEETLAAISKFLNLETPLSKRYKTQKYTQIWGDPSENITKGKIRITKSKQLNFPKKLLENCEKTYLKTLKFLQKNATN